jgi:hypothetical protein
MRGAGVVNDRDWIVEVGTNGVGRDFLNGRQLKEIRF